MANTGKHHRTWHSRRLREARKGGTSEMETVVTREEAAAAPPRETGTPAAILLIETSDPERRAAVRARIEAILPGAAETLLVSPDPESFAQNVDAAPDRPILVVHTAPEAELGLVFRRTQHAARALTAWSNHAEALLKVLRRAGAGVLLSRTRPSWPIPAPGSRSWA
jgi:hypothetical protein